MDNKYYGKICPYCKVAFKEGDEIVICSDCEMPHHKECWIDNKGCTTFGCQGTIQGVDIDVEDSLGTAPKYEIRNDSNMLNGGNPLVCNNCGAALDGQSLFCPKCGSPVSYGNGTANSSAARAINDATQKISSGIDSFLKEYETNNYMDPELEGYIGSKKEYYLQEFSKLKGLKRYHSFNPAAFFLAPFWLLYRKMYIPGAIVLGISFVLSLLNGGVSVIASLVLATCVGVFGNYYYMYDLENRIKKGANLTGIQKEQYVIQNGDVNAMVPSVAAVLYVFICVILFS